MDTTYAEQLQVSQTIQSVVFDGVSGGTIEFFFDRAINAAPNVEILIVDIGTNDLDNGHCPLVAATKLIDFDLHQLRTTKVKSIVYCSILFRTPNKIHVRDFNRKVTIIFNRVIKAHCAIEPGLHYHSHRGCWTNDISSWSIDELHPNPWRYKKSTRQALFLGARHC